jgi:hypothetical protein
MTRADAGPETSRRVLAPVERVAELLFGLIMVLTFTGSLSVAKAGRDDVRAMLIGALGCNLAWGIIDGVLYLMASLADRRSDVLAWRAICEAQDPLLALLLTGAVSAQGQTILAGAQAPTAAPSTEYEQAPTWDWSASLYTYLLPDEGNYV